MTKVKSPEKSGLSETGKASDKDHLSAPAAATLTIQKEHQKVDYSEASEDDPIFKELYVLQECSPVLILKL